MAVPTLRRYSATIAVASTNQTLVPAVPTARALVISKLLFAMSSSGTVSATVGGNGIVWSLALSAGQVYTETGIVLLAGDSLVVNASTTGCWVHVFGEEVDN